MKIWICPGSFDPVTSGHLDIIQRAAKRCDSLIVAIGINDKKVPSFSIEERKAMLEKVTADIENVKVTVFSGLLIDYARKTGAAAIIKGFLKTFRVICKGEGFSDASENVVKTITARIL